MQKYSENLSVRAAAGQLQAVAGATIRVRSYPALADVVLYRTNDTGDAYGAAGTTLTTDANGRFEFYAPDGRYRIDWSGTGIAAGYVEDVLIEDPLDADLGVFSAIHLGADVYLERDAADILAQRRRTNPQALRLYNTYTDDLNYERFALRWSGTAMFLMTERAGTGLARQLIMGTVGASDIVFRTSDTARWNINSSGHLLANTDNAFDIGAVGATRPRNVYVAGFVSAGSVSSTSFTSIADGMAPPAAQVGQARLYVDSGDGDLKVVFGDGTVKTIVTDT